MKPDRKIAFLPRKKNVKKSFKNVFFSMRSARSRPNLGRIEEKIRKFVDTEENEPAKVDHFSTFGGHISSKSTNFSLSKAVPNRSRWLLSKYGRRKNAIFSKTFRKFHWIFTPDHEIWLENFACAPLTELWGIFWIESYEQKACWWSFFAPSNWSISILSSWQKTIHI